MHKSLLCLLAAVASCPLTLHAEAPSRFDSTPGKLPKDVVPNLYELTLTPDIEKKSFTGLESVEFSVKKPTEHCVLNAKDLTIDSPELIPLGGTGSSNAAKPTVTLDAAQETCTFTFPSPLAPGSYRLRFKFAGKISHDGAGLFASTYTGADGKPETMLCTQMEPTDARRMFPCWDEPSFRAKFRLSVELSPAIKGWTAVSNMPVDKSAPANNGGVIHTFQVTPPMASYLVVLAVGNFDSLSGEADGTPIHIIAPIGRAQHGKYALETAEKLLHFYNDYFGIKYPLPKLDLIAVSGGGGFGGAMENWGGITFAEPALLYDPATSSQTQQQGVFEVIAHEMAHQWFGDLVTTAWWDNLWLNEGFAEWMGEYAADRFNPGWEYWATIANSKNFAMSSDARSTTHPIQQPVANEMDAVRAFDEITYNKGQGFIRMLEGYLGTEKFRDGLRRYMKAHAYGNATTADLWAALSEASGQPVGDIAAQWTEQPGFPLVSVGRAPDKPDELTLSQRRFTVHDPHAAPLRWKIPVTYSAVGSDDRGSLLLEADTTKAAPAAGPPLKFNAAGLGYYRVGYDEATLRPLLAQFNRLPAPDQNNLLSDAWAAVRADLGSVTAYLDMVRALRPNETNPLVWTQVLEVARTIDHLYVGGDAESRTAWRKGMISLLKPVFARCGWEPARDEAAPVKELRESLITRLGFFGDASVIEGCRERFTAFLKDPAALSPDIRRAVCDVVGHYGDAATYDQLLALASKASSDELKELYYGALASASDPALAQRTLELAAREETPSNYAFPLLFGASVSAEQGEMVAKFGLAHLDQFVGKVSPMAKNRLVPAFYQGFNDARWADELEKYAAHPGALADPVEVKKSAESIRTDADLKTRVLPEVNRWVKSQQ